MNSPKNAEEPCPLKCQQYNCVAEVDFLCGCEECLHTERWRRCKRHARQHQRRPAKKPIGDMRLRAHTAERELDRFRFNAWQSRKGMPVPLLRPGQQLPQDDSGKLLRLPRPAAPRVEDAEPPGDEP
jgi:hypothetical protein